MLNIPERYPLDPPERLICWHDCEQCHHKWPCDLAPTDEDIAEREAEDDSMTKEELIAWCNQPHECYKVAP